MLSLRRDDKKLCFIVVFSYLLFLIFIGIKEVQFVRSTIMWFETFVTIAPFFLVQMMRMCQVHSQKSQPVLLQVQWMVLTAPQKLQVEHMVTYTLLVMQVI